MNRRLARVAMRFFEGGDRHGKEQARLPDHDGVLAGRTGRQQFGDERLFMNPGEVERLQSGGQGLPAQASRCFHLCLLALL